MFTLRPLGFLQRFPASLGSPLATLRPPAPAARKKTLHKAERSQREHSKTRLKLTVLKQKVQKREEKQRVARKRGENAKKIIAVSRSRPWGHLGYKNGANARGVLRKWNVKTRKKLQNPTKTINYGASPTPLEICRDLRGVADAS